MQDRPGETRRRPKAADFGKVKEEFTRIRQLYQLRRLNRAEGGRAVAIEGIRIKTKSLGLSKAIQNARFEVRTVLTVEPFQYVDLWLRRQHKDEALFYWRQARDFHRAARGLPLESAPLVLYYCFMNAAKALLSSKGINFSPYHGVAHHKMRGPNSKVVLSNEGIAIRANGIVPALANYFGEAEPSNTHSLEAVLYNLVFVHRTYCLSYANKRERFLPLRDVAFMPIPLAPAPEHKPECDQ